MPKLKVKKDPFSIIPEEFKDAVAGGDEAGIRDRIAKCALDDEALRKAQKDDLDLSNLKEQVKLANEPYKEGFKMNRLKVQFCQRVLEDKGKEAGDSGLEESPATA